MSSTRSRTEELEAIAYEFWRAPEVEELDGWRLRFAHGITGRANSVWPNGGGVLPLEEKLDRAEAWFRARGLAVLFQLTDAAQPDGLEDALAGRGYELRGVPVSVEIAQLDEVLARTSGDAEVSDDFDDAWLGLWAGSRGFENRAAARALLLQGDAAFARIGDVAVGRGVAARGWLGITSMVTRPEARRQGHARAIVHALARWARERGCTDAMLQVESTNAPARTLYASTGFVPHHEYHYRKLA
ncbi:MAG TPA: GNAT family N-acetyltransferase [Caldimonas sp.]|nr:GNAT family N-acetyltransferase [Caldimonas sp.]